MRSSFLPIICCSALYSYVRALSALREAPYLQTRSRRLALLYLFDILMCYFTASVVFMLVIYIPNWGHNDTYELQQVSTFSPWLNGQRWSPSPLLHPKFPPTPRPPSVAWRTTGRPGELGPRVQPQPHGPRGCAGAPTTVGPGAWYTTGRCVCVCAGSDTGD